MNDEAKFCLQCGTPTPSKPPQNNLAENVQPVQNNLAQNVPPVQNTNPVQGGAIQNNPVHNTPVQNVPVQNVPVQNYPGGEFQVYPASEPKKKSGWKGIYTVIVILAILMIGAAVAVFFLFSDYKNGDKKADSSSSKRHSSSKDDDDDEEDDDDRSSRRKDETRASTQEDDEEYATEEDTEYDIESEEATTEVAESETTEAAAPAYTRDMVSTISASSYLIEEDYDIEHEPELAMDGFDDTAWVEDVDGNGVGEYITIVFTEECTLEGVSFLNGYQKTDELFEKNGRPSQVKLEFSDGYYETVDFDDEMGWTSMDFDRIHVTDNVKITILGVYEGTEYDDTCITEVVFY